MGLLRPAYPLACLFLGVAGLGFLKSAEPSSANKPPRTSAPVGNLGVGGGGFAGFAGFGGASGMYGLQGGLGGGGALGALGGGGGVLGANGGALGIGGGGPARIPKQQKAPTPPVAPASPAKPVAKLERKQASPAVTRAKVLREKLANYIFLDKPLDSQPLKDAIDFFQDRFDVSIIINGEAFKSELMALDVEQQQVKLPKITGVPLERVLRLLLDQIDGDYRNRGAYLEIAPRKHFLKLGKVSVSAHFQKQPLTDALEELSALSGVNIVVDENVADLASKEVTATFDNAPLETAVRFLAYSRGLDVFKEGKVILVTSQEVASALHEKRQEQRQIRQR